MRSKIFPENVFVKSPITLVTKFIKNATAIAFSHLILVQYLTKNISTTNPARITGRLAIPSAIYREGHIIYREGHIISACAVEFNGNANSSSSVHFLKVEEVFIESGNNVFYR